MSCICCTILKCDILTLLSQAFKLIDANSDRQIDWQEVHDLDIAMLHKKMKEVADKEKAKEEL